MDPQFQHLPPLKKLRLMQRDLERAHQQQQLPSHSEEVKSLQLPGKKRKQSRLDYDDDAAATYPCLPKKKRIWAIDPDLLYVESSLEVEDGDDGDKENIDPLEEEEDGIMCDVCQSTDGDPSNPIVFCDGCDLMVHASCYGNPLVKAIPEGDWFCGQCIASKKREKLIYCCLCTTKGVAMKPTKDGRWAHITCSLFVPEVYFEDPEGREGVCCSEIPSKRWEDGCYLCKIRGGCVIECSEMKCELAFHVTCRLKEDLCVECREGKKSGGIVVGFCDEHTKLWERQQESGKYKIVARN